MATARRCMKRNRVLAGLVLAAAAAVAAPTAVLANADGERDTARLLGATVSDIVQEDYQTRLDFAIDVVDFWLEILLSPVRGGQPKPDEVRELERDDAHQVVNVLFSSGSDGRIAANLEVWDEILNAIHWFKAEQPDLPANRVVTSVVDHYAKNETITRSIEIPPSPDSQAAFRSTLKWRVNHGMVSRAIDAAQARQEAERRAHWEAVRAESFQLAGGHIIFLVGGDPKVVPNEPGEPRSPSGAERERIWRELHAGSTRINDGRLIVARSLMGGGSIMFEVPRQASGSFRPVEGEDLNRIWRQNAAVRRQLE
jgi:hypothetical protein